MGKETFVGRHTDMAKLQKVLFGDNRARGGLSLVSIEGPGGIGKTALLEQAFATLHLAPRMFLELRAVSKDTLNATGPFALVNALANSAKSPPTYAKPPGYFFPATKRLLAAVNAVRNAVRKELDKKFPGDRELRQLLYSAVDDLLAQGLPLREIDLRIKQRPVYRVIEKRSDAAWLESTLRSLRAIRPEPKWLAGPVGDFFDVARRNAIKENALKAVATALLADLDAILAKPRTKLDGVERLLLIIDDYEFLAQHLGEFLVTYLLPGLRDANFHSLVVILGRDKLAATHPAWNKELGTSMVERLSLKPLELEEFIILARAHGINDQATRDRIWNDTSGYPYLIQLWIDELEETRAEGLDEPSALMLKSFYDRTTRFMADEQRDWLDRVLFLDDVNKKTLRIYFTDPAEIDRVQKWFECESSIRDPSAAAFRVRGPLRSRLTMYLKRHDPDRHDALAAKAGGNSALG